MCKDTSYGRISNVEHIGRLIRMRRKEAQITQRDAAALAGVGERFMGEVERGKSSAQIGSVLQVLDRFGLEVWVLPRGKSPSDIDG